MDEEAERPEVVVDRHDDHALARQRFTVVERQAAAAEDQRTAVDPDHHRQTRAGLGSASRR